jgi:2-C-methyl-D-erythritol 4-phosphate cytidylyltransferase
MEGALPVWAVVPAGGNGCRFSADSDADKLLAHIQGQSVLQRTVGTLLAVPAILGLVLVAGEARLETYQALVNAHFPDAPVRWALGGADRRESVFNGLCALPDAEENGLVVIHDAARPLIRRQTVEASLSAVWGDVQGAVVGIPIHDTLKRTLPPSAGNVPPVVETLDRCGVWRAQTPQVFRRDAILRAHRTVPRTTPVTDDAQLMEQAGLGPVVMVPGEESNLKITTPDDLRLATAWLTVRQSFGEETSLLV